MSTPFAAPDPATFVHDRFAAAPSTVSTGRSGAPSPDEAAAIAAAIEHLWPKPVLVAADHERKTPPWRFSGRWWIRPVAVRRDRPFY